MCFPYVCIHIVHFHWNCQRNTMAICAHICADSWGKPSKHLPQCSKSCRCFNEPQKDPLLVPSNFAIYLFQLLSLLFPPPHPASCLEDGRGLPDPKPSLFYAAECFPFCWYHWTAAQTTSATKEMNGLWKWNYPLIFRGSAVLELSKIFPIITFLFKMQIITVKRERHTYHCDASN